MASAFKIKPQDIILTVSVVIVGSLTYFVAMPQTESLKQKSAELKAKRAEAVSLTQQKADLISMSDRLPQYKDDIERLEIAFPKEDQTIEALIQAKTITERSSLSLAGLTPSKSKEGTLGVTLAVSGSFESLIRFVQELKANLRPIIVKSFSVTAGDEKSGGAVNLNIATSFEYVQAAAAPVAGSAPSLPPAADEPDAATAGKKPSL